MTGPKKKPPRKKTEDPEAKRKKFLDQLERCVLNQNLKIQPPEVPRSTEEWTYASTSPPLPPEPMGNGSDMVPTEIDFPSQIGEPY